MRNNLRSTSCTRILITLDSVVMVMVIKLYKEIGKARSRVYVLLNPVFC